MSKSQCSPNRTPFSTVKVGFDRELSATEFILMAYGSKMSEVLWNDFPQKSEVRKGLKSRVEQDGRRSRSCPPEEHSNLI